MTVQRSNTDDDDMNFNFQQLNQIESINSLVRDRVKPRIFNHSSIDGEALFGVLQNFIENLNNEEIPIIKNALDNILLDRANNVIAKLIEDFKLTLNVKFKDESLPMDITEIYTEVETLTSSFITNVTEKLDETLRPKQVTPLLIDCLNKIRYQTSIILELNKKNQDEWFDEEYNILIKNLKIKEYTRPEEINDYITSFTEEWLNGLHTFLDNPSEYAKSAIQIFIKILKENIFDTIKKTIGKVSTYIANSSKEISTQLENAKIKIKVLEEQCVLDKKLCDEKQLENTKLFEQKTELENKVEKLTRDLKIKEKEYIQISQMENQKLTKITSENEDELKEKDKKITNLEKTIELLNQQISQKNHELSLKNAEYNKEITRLTIDVEKCKSQNNSLRKNNSKQGNEPDINIKVLFKTIQSNFTEFKESLESLDREKESIVNILTF